MGGMWWSLPAWVAEAAGAVWSRTPRDHGGGTPLPVFPDTMLPTAQGFSSSSSIHHDDLPLSFTKLGKMAPGKDLFETVWKTSFGAMDCSWMWPVLCHVVMRGALLLVGL